MYILSKENTQEKMEHMHMQKVLQLFSHEKNKILIQQNGVIAPPIEVENYGLHKNEGMHLWHSIMICKQTRVLHLLSLTTVIL